MDIEKLIEAVKLCGSTPKVDQCKKCTYWAGGDMSKCIPRMTEEAANALSTLQAENEKLRAELDDLRIQWDMYGGDVGITAVYKELEQVKRENLVLKEKIYGMEKN